MLYYCFCFMNFGDTVSTLSVSRVVSTQQPLTYGAQKPGATNKRRGCDTLTRHLRRVRLVL